MAPRGDVRVALAQIALLSQPSSVIPDCQGVLELRSGQAKTIAPPALSLAVPGALSAAARSSSMQAPGPPGGPQAAIGSHAKDTPLGEQLYVPAHIKNNFDVLSFK